VGGGVKEWGVGGCGEKSDSSVRLSG